MFDSIITLGDSWSWGTDLPDGQRADLRFDSVLGKKLGLTVTNLARESASNFCYKWHWIDWINSESHIYKHPLVVVGITAPHRQLIWNNQADFFQESPGRLISEKMVHDNWGNNKNSGGFVRAFPNHVDFPNQSKKTCQENFYRYNFDDTMAEIYSIWEIKFLDLLIKEHGGFPIFWSNFYSYTQIQLPWAKNLLNNCILANNLQSLFVYENKNLSPQENKFFYTPWSHPNEIGHQHIAEIIANNIQVVAR
jgi:hypothetical protein